MHRAIASLMLILSLVATAGCAKKLTPQEVASISVENYNSQDNPVTQKLILSVQCRDGEREWDYICNERFDPNPLHPDKDKKPMIQRVAWRNVWISHGVLTGEQIIIAQAYARDGDKSVVLPEGPIPSLKEWLEIRKKEYETVLKLGEAERHLSDGEHLIQRQRELIATLRHDGRPTQAAEKLLVDLEKTQAVYLADRERIRNELFGAGKPGSPSIQ